MVYIARTRLDDIHHYAMLAAMDSENCYNYMVAQLETRLARLKGRLTQSETSQ
jgi:hypothetical protein